jgi:apolipoprotein D and lipocalin family protein
MKSIILVLISIMYFNSTNSQSKVTVIPYVDLDKYSGKWFEIARLPNSFERKLKCITATYTLRKDGKITVLNKGHYLTDPGKINTATGVAWVPDKNDPAKLKVQFFWPFSGNYWIIYLDKDYKHALVGDPSYKYLWILAREKKLDENIYQMLLKKAIENGFDIKPLIRVDHDCN